MSAATTDPHIEPSGQFKAWLESLDLMDLWVKTAELPTNRCDSYRKELLKIYTTERRKFERSQRFQLSRSL